MASLFFGFQYFASQESGKVNQESPAIDSQSTKQLQSDIEQLQEDLDTEKEKNLQLQASNPPQQSQENNPADDTDTDNPDPTSEEEQSTEEWRSNPNNCTADQWISAETPYDCIDKPVAIAPVTVAPDACSATFLDSFDAVQYPVQKFTELKDAMIGTWQGCVSTPWEDPTLVQLSFKTDGTYTSKLLDTSKSKFGSALYYGTDDNHPSKQYEIYDVQDNGLASGDINIYFDSGSTTTSLFYDLKSSGNHLEFSFLHRNQYGPLEVQLTKTSD